jgi:hypothetical protein
MTPETGNPLQKSLDAIDGLRRRVYALGWVTVVATLAMYVRLEYLHRTTDNLERLLGASVAALTFLIAWVGFAIILTVIRTGTRVLRAIELTTRTSR